MRRTWLAALAVVACSCETGPAPTHRPVAPSGTPTHDMRKAMRAHFEAAVEVQRAVAHGQLTTARDTASWLVAHAAPRTDDLIAAARQISEARDVSAAGARTGELAYACSTCHLASTARPTFRFPPEPEAVPGIEAQMQRHQWAAARLWEGVIGPDDAAWFAGARAMATATIDLAATTHAKPNSDVVGYAETMRELATRATETSNRRARAELYGAMLNTCASCHAVVRPNTVAERE